MIDHAAASLELRRPATGGLRRLEPRASLVAAAALAMLASTIAVGATAFLYRRFDAGVIAAAPRSAEAAAENGRAPIDRPRDVDREGELPRDAALTILVSSYPTAEPSTDTDVAALTRWLEADGFRVFHADVDLGARGRWRRVLVGAYTDRDTARRDADRLKTTVRDADLQLMSASAARGIATPFDDGASGRSRSQR